MWLSIWRKHSLKKSFWERANQARTPQVIGVVNTLTTLVLVAGLWGWLSSCHPVKTHRSETVPTLPHTLAMADPLESITLGGGCFWCIEAVMQRLRGVDTVISGYAGGSVPNPTYKQICTGTTGHAEVVQVHFDPAVISLDELLYVFFRLHDPTTLNRQGADVGTQYRSIILYTSEAQRDAAQQAIDSVNAEKLYPNPVVTQVVPLELFYPAEDYHQDYYNQNSTQPYCRAVIDPKVQKLLKSYGQYLKD